MSSEEFNTENTEGRHGGHGVEKKPVVLVFSCGEWYYSLKQGARKMIKEQGTMNSEKRRVSPYRETAAFYIDDYL